MDVAAKDATDSAETADAADVVMVVDVTTDADSATTVVCGSSFSCAAVADSATDADAAMAVDADARQHNISCIGLKRRSHFSVSFFIYIYNADPEEESLWPENLQNQ